MPKNDVTTGSIIESETFTTLLERAVERVRDTAQHHANEATIASAFELELHSVLRQGLDVSFHPEKEVSPGGQRFLSRGRIDSKFGSFVIEFKRPSTFKTSAQRQKAVNQLTGYLVQLGEGTGEDYIGYVTDGVTGIFARLEQGHIQEEGYQELSAEVLRRIASIVVGLQSVSLNSSNLIKDFCRPSTTSTYRRLVLELYKSLTTTRSGRTRMLFTEWQELFRLAHDDTTKQAAIAKRREALGSVVGEPLTTNNDEYRALYALQTAYAIIVKLIAYKVVSDVFYGQVLFRFADLRAIDDAELRRVLDVMEQGSTFRDAGIVNLLEGDFFSWYAQPSEWSAPLAQLVREVAGTLGKYEDKVLAEEASVSRDLFRELYQEAIPSAVRHSLGEFYTPPWLADLVVAEAVEPFDARDDAWRAIDPCAGSGTFVTRLIERVLAETTHLEPEARLEEVLTRVVAVDLNPLAVLTARVNYFVNIAPLARRAESLHIPVYLGDSSYAPQPRDIGPVQCFTYQISTLKGSIDVTIPASALKDASAFSRVMAEVEERTAAQDADGILAAISALCADADLTPGVIDELRDLSVQFVELEKLGWNGIWPRIVGNFLATATLGQFDIIVGNPPWIDWKNLPLGYRERIKQICVDRGLFSGDRVVGGINLNICALIANVAADRWLAAGGTMALLMPENLLFQQTYEGFRRFSLPTQGYRLYLDKVLDFTGSGHPFKPVQYPFHGYFYSDAPRDYSVGVPVTSYKKRRGTPAIEVLNTSAAFGAVEKHFDTEASYVGTVRHDVTAFAYARTRERLADYRQIAGDCAYIGREGIEFYPQEVFLLCPLPDVPARDGTMYFRNFQNPGRSKYVVAPQTVLLETEFLFPLVKGIDIQRFGLQPRESFYVPFPYDSSSTRLPIPFAQLRQRSPLLAKYLNRHRDVIGDQTSYNERIIGKGSQEFHALARVGAYSFHDVHVAYRDNSTWAATVVSQLDVPWGGSKRALFQNHAPSMAERADGGMIDSEEAWYVAGVLNTSVVTEFVTKSSDSRTFKIRPPVFVPVYDRANAEMRSISELSRRVSELGSGEKSIREQRQIEELYLSLASQRHA